MNRRPLPSHETLRSRFHYDPLVGNLVYAPRQAQDTINASWNSRFAGRVAGKSVKDGLIVWLDGVGYHAARLIWVYVHGDLRGNQSIDHINRNNLDNRLANLRVATISDNNCNRTRVLARQGVVVKAPYKGVQRQRSGWKATIYKNNVQHFLGSFATPEQARDAYNEKARELHGEFFTPS